MPQIREVDEHEIGETERITVDGNVSENSLEASGTTPRRRSSRAGRGEAAPRGPIFAKEGANQRALARENPEKAQKWLDAFRGGSAGDSRGSTRDAGGSNSGSTGDSSSTGGSSSGSDEEDSSDSTGGSTRGSGTRNAGGTGGGSTGGSGTRNAGGTGGGSTGGSGSGDAGDSGSDEEDSGDSSSDEEGFGDSSDSTGGSSSGSTGGSSSGSAGGRKSRKKTAFYGPHEFDGHCDPVDDDDSQRIEKNLQEARKGYDDREHTPSDYRALTLLQIETALQQHEKDGTIPDVIFLKLEKEQPGLLGIVAGDGGTTLTSPKLGKGTIVTRENKSGYWKFTIRWGRKRTADAKYTTIQVLKEADEGTAIALKDAYQHCATFLGALYAFIKTFIIPFIRDDRLKKKTDTEKLEGDALERSKEATAIAWKLIKDSKACSLLNGEELKLLKQDKGLEAALKKESIQDLLRLGDAAEGHPTGLAGLMLHPDRGFTKGQLKEAKVYIRAAQGAFRVGRLFTAESMIAPLSPKEMPPGVSLPFPKDETISHRVEHNDFGLPVRALLARGSEKGFCKWMLWAPMNDMLDLTRPAEKGTIKATSKHSNSSSKARKGTQLGNW